MTKRNHIIIPLLFLFLFIPGFSQKKQINDTLSLLNTYSNSANLLISNHDFYKANVLLISADSLNEIIGNNTFTENLRQVQSNYYAATGNYRKALIFEKKAIKLYKKFINEDINSKTAKLEAHLETTRKELENEKIRLENKLQEQQQNEANFQLIAILIISLVSVGFIITFYYLRAKKSIAERLAQEMQVAALKERLIALQLNHEGIQKSIDLDKIMNLLPTPLTERECETLELSLKGFSNAEIAKKLFVSINTIKFHLRNTYQKLVAKL